MRTRAIDGEASEWVVRLESTSVPPEVRAEFEAWCAADPRHHAAYLRQRDTWTRLDRLQALRPPPAGLEEPNRLPLRAWAQRRSPRTRLPYPRRRLAALAAVLVVACVGWLLWNLGFAPEAAGETYATVVGGFQRVILPDESVIELNTDSQLRVEFDSRRRLVQLERGEASFSVVRDSARPFVVMAEETAVRAVGTQFNVRRRADSVEVMVVEGIVAVGPREAVGGARTLHPSFPVVTAGNIAIAAPAGFKVRELEPDEGQRVLAWHSGMLFFEGQTLAEAAEEFNRYNRRKLAIADPAIAALRIGGQFRSTNAEVFARVVERRYGLQVTETTERIVLRGAESSP